MPIFIFPLQVNGNFKLPQKPKYTSNGNKSTFFIEANVMNISASSRLSWLLRRCFLNIFISNLAFRFPWQPSKFTVTKKYFDSNMIQKGNATLLQRLPKGYFAVDVDRSKCLHATSSNALFCTHYVDQWGKY